MKNPFFNRMKFIFFAAGCIFCSICFFACTNSVSSDDYDSDDNEKMYEIKGNLFVDGSAPKILNKSENQFRGVSAKVPDEIFYSVSAKNAENSEKSYTAEVSDSTFSVKLTKGSWNILAEGFSDAEKTISVLKGSTTISVENENSVKTGISVKMLPRTDGKGNISLSIETEDGSGIKSVSAELKKNDESSSSYSEKINFSGNAAKIEKSDIPSGVYVLSLKFYSENDGAGELLYTADEIVNVFNNLTTDSWQGNSVYFNGGKFVVSKSAVENFKMNTFFVQGETDGTYSPAASANDNNAGTYFAPFATVQAAVDKINSLNDGTTEYTIYVDGTVTADTIYGDYSENNSSFVNISPDSTLNLAIKSLSSEKAVVDGGRSSKTADTTGWRVFYIGANAKVAFENITVMGGSLNDAGGGIYCDGNLSLRNCTINGDINYYGGNLILEGEIAVEGLIKIDTGLQIGIKNLDSLKTLKLSGKTDSEEWIVGTEIIHSVDGTVLSDLICSKFAVQNKTANKKSLCIVPSSTDATKGVLSVAGASVIPSFDQPDYTLTLSPASFTPGETDNKVSLVIKDSDGNTIIPDSIEFVLYQNKNKVAVLENGLIPSWIPEGTYTVIATAKVGEYSYDAEMNIIISENIAISNFSSAPSASDFPKITASSSQELVTLRNWVNAGSNMEGITISLVDDVDLTDCSDWQPIGFVSESENKPFKGTFDGRGHSLSFDISNIDYSNKFRKIGVFYKNDGVIENLVINQYLQDGKTLIVYGNSSQYAYSNAGGGICIENTGIVRNCINKSSIIASTFSDIGGICMSNAETGIIENCLFSGSITMDRKCSNGGDNQKSAGICPRNNGTIKNCVSNGSIKTEAEIDQNLPDSILNNISGAISVYTEGFIKNCYWLKNNIKSGTSNKNRIVYTKSTYKKLTCIPDSSKITGCGYFDTNSPSASVTAGTTSECKSNQTLAYSGTLIDMLNVYVSANSDIGLKEWKSDSSGNLTLEF